MKLKRNNYQLKYSVRNYRSVENEGYAQGAFHTECIQKIITFFLPSGNPYGIFSNQQLDK
ncbi:MAG: hypothetical protein LBC68_09220 [Prevotellaceae bacterium]|nr:hypothetical protein [Prevotellaceae bacterium]